MFMRVGAGMGRAGASQASRTQTRSMATLKDLKMRMDSITNISKITSSMKMVSTAKFKQAEHQLKAARTMGAANQALFDVSGLAEEEQDAKKPVAVLISGDRGLCAGIHSSISKKAKLILQDKPMEICVLGDKPKSQLTKLHGDQIRVHVNGVGRTPPTFDEALFFTQNVIEEVPEFDGGILIYNKFVSALTYDTMVVNLKGKESLQWSEKLQPYEVQGDAIMPWYHEFQLATSVFHALKEGSASEQSTRMSAMDNATNNAHDMIDALRLTYNRTRQAVITRELIEIISGASALEG